MLLLGYPFEIFSSLIYPTTVVNKTTFAHELQYYSLLCALCFYKHVTEAEEHFDRVLQRQRQTLESQRVKNVNYIHHKAQPQQSDGATFFLPPSVACVFYE